MHKVLHTWYDVDRLYMSKREGRRGFTNIQDNVNALVQRLEDYIKSAEKDWSGRPETIDNTSINRIKITRKKNGKKNNSMDIPSDK